MKILVTGAAGQIGFYLIDFLLSKTDHEIFAASPSYSNQEDSRLNKIWLDISDFNLTKQVLRDIKPDFIFNFAAITYIPDSYQSPLNVFKVNTGALVNILDFVKCYLPNCRVFSAGSVDQIEGNSPYAISKRAAADWISFYRNSFNIFCCQGLLCNTESPLRSDQFVSKKIAKGAARIALTTEENFIPMELGNLDSKRDWSHSEDVVRLVWKAINQDKPEDFIFGSGELHSIREFVELAFAAVGLNGQWQGVGLNEVFRLTDSNKIAAKIDKKYFRPDSNKIEKLDTGEARRVLREVAGPDAFKSLVFDLVQHEIKNLLK